MFKCDCGKEYGKEFEKVNCGMRNHKPSAASAGYSALVQKLDSYIAFLNEANHGPVSVAYAHGWRCPQSDIDKGERLRREIAELREAL